MLYCNDLDLLYWEPSIFRDAAFASQTLLSGTGDLSGSTFTIDSGSLTASHVESKMVIVLSGAVAGCFPIVSVNGATQLSLGVLHDPLFPDYLPETASPVGTALDLTFHVRTFSPQIRVVSDLLSQTAGIVPGAALETQATITNPQALRSACVTGTLQMIYSALAAVAEDPSNFATRADFHERRYRRAVREARVELDSDGDGTGDVMRLLNVVDLVRT